MFSASISWLLMIPAVFIIGLAACIADCSMKLFHVLGMKRLSRQCLFKLSQLTEIILGLWGTRVIVNSSNMKHLDPKRPTLFVCSHHSSLDTFLLVKHLQKHLGDRKIAFISRSGLDNWIPAVSFYIRQYCYSIPRRNKTIKPTASVLKARENSLSKFARQIDTEGNAVILFPEGVKNYSKGEHNSVFHRNGLRLMLENMPNAQIVPIGIAGTGLFYSTPRCLKNLRYDRPQFNRCIQIEVLPFIRGVQPVHIEETIDLLETEIHSCATKLQRFTTNNSRLINGLRHKWIP